MPYWKPLSPRSIAILGRLRAEIAQVELALDQATNRELDQPSSAIKNRHDLNGSGQKDWRPPKGLAQ
jgi:hypothetical protein